MSYARNDGRSNSSLQREREREKKRREQQFMKPDQAGDEPFFSEPKKVYTSRQDSLTRNIHNTLGDSQAVSGILLKNQNLYLGTSRSSQGPPTPAPAQPQSDAPLYTSSNKNKDSSRHSSVPHNQSSKQQSSSSTHHTSSSASSTLKSREDALSNRSHSSQSKHSHSSYHKNRRSQGSYPSTYKLKTGNNENQSSTGTANERSNTHAAANNRNTMLEDSEKAPNLISERDRVSSVDSDIFGGVETIFKEMTDCPPTLTEIKTPSVFESGFNFSAKRKLSGIDSNNEGTNIGVMDSGRMASDVESSGEETSDDEDEENFGNSNWNLGKFKLENFKEESQQSSNPLLSTSSTVDESVTKSTNSDNGRRSLPNTKSGRSPGNSSLTKDAVPQNRNQARGRKMEKQSSSVVGGKNRSTSSSSNQRSSSAGRNLNVKESSQQHLSDSFHSKQNFDGNEFSSSRPSNNESFNSGMKKPSSKAFNRKSKESATPPTIPKSSSPTSGEMSRVSKETISSTTGLKSERQRVGRKAPVKGHSTSISTNSSEKVETTEYDSKKNDSEDDMSDEDVNMSSDSNSDSSSDSGSNSDDDASDIENDQAESSAWSLKDMRTSAEQNPQEIQERIPKSNPKNAFHNTTSPRAGRTPMEQHSSPTSASSANSGTKTDKLKSRNDQQGKKHVRKSSTSSIPPAGARLTEKESTQKTTSRNNPVVHSSTVDRTGTKGLKTGWKSGNSHQQEDFDSREVSKPEMVLARDSYNGLLVRIRSTLLPNSAQDVSHKKSKLAGNSSSLARTSSSESNSIHVLPQKRTFTTVSTGSETEQPIRKANRVQVAVADSQDLADNCNSTTYKRKHMTSEHSYEDDSRKRQRKDKAKLKQTSPRSGGFSQNLSQHKTSANVDQWHSSSAGVETSRREEVHNNTDNYSVANHTMTENQRQESPTSNDPSQHVAPASSASFVLPDSSVPGEQERIQTSDWYMREGKRMKHEGDGMVDSRTGRTRAGEAMNRALAYFEASLFFIMSGSVMETENKEERLEVSSNSATHSPNNMYKQTIPLLDFVLKMRPHVEQDDRIFKRIMISCLRCQAVLYLRIFKLKKDVAVKYSELLTDQFKSMVKTNRTPSPWHHANSAPNVVSPMSPAVPSPFGHHGPSPISSNVEQVSSSTQAGKMTPPTHAGYSFPQKMFDIYRQHHSIMCDLLQAHEKWDQGENMLEDHADFFRNIDTLCNRTLTFHSSLRDVFLYHKTVLHQLRTLTANSPRE